jgi:S-adenosylmethionine-diacylgycerolhomoserine-N-methlytransferase
MVDSMPINSTVETQKQADHQKQLMDRMYRVQRHFYDATRAYYLLGRDELITNLKVPDRASVLEIGCGTGRNLVRIARTYPLARVHGIDISDEMLIHAGKAVHGHGLVQRMKLAQGDAVTFRSERSFGAKSFDRICLSYTLSMIPDWKGVLENAVSHLSPGGELHIVDFGSCRGLPGFFRTGLTVWLGRFHVTARADLVSFAEQLAARHGLQLSEHSSHRGYAQHVVLNKPD